MARRRSGKKIDFTRWNILSFHSSLSAGVVGLNLDAGRTTAETLLRMRGNLLAFLDSASAPNIGIQVGVGIRKAAEGTGATVTVSPLQDADYPWIYFAAFDLYYEEKVTDVIDVPIASGFREAIDNKAMRIIRPGEELQIVVENVTVASAGVCRIGLNARILLGS